MNRSPLARSKEKRQGLRSPYARFQAGRRPRDEVIGGMRMRPGSRLTSMPGVCLVAGLQFGALFIGSRPIRHPFRCAVTIGPKRICPPLWFAKG
jgi:hypothetical protein